MRGAPCPPSGVQVPGALRDEINRLMAERDEAKAVLASSAAAFEAQRSAAAVREAELGEELRRARRATERALSSGETDVIAVEKSLRTKYEEDVSHLQERARFAEERVRQIPPGPSTNGRRPRRAASRPWTMRM